MSSDVVVGLSQIYLQQLVPLLDAVLLRAEPPRHVADVDRLLIRLFDDEDDDSPSAQQIPVQAFEQLFGVYSQAVSLSGTYSATQRSHQAYRKLSWRRHVSRR